MLKTDYINKMAKKKETINMSLAQQGHVKAGNLKIHESGAFLVDPVAKETMRKREAQRAKAIASGGPTVAR
jgi:hypothetical protein